MAAKAGMDPMLPSKPCLTSDAYASDVRADEAMAQDLGITGVPHFLINDKWSVPGAQDVETLVLTLDRAWERSEGLESTAASA